jgi:hypothetical protein
MEMNLWTPGIVHFMEDASAQTRYFRELGGIVKAAVPAGSYLCDAGCGMGQLAIELAPWAGGIEAVDRSVNAISYLSGRLAMLGVTNVAPIASEMQRVRPMRTYDYMVFSLSMGVEDAYGCARALGVQRFCVVNKVHARMDAERARTATALGHGAPGWQPRQLTPRPRRPIVYDFAAELKRLKRHGYRCSGREVELEFGQPFKSLDEAQWYYRIFRNHTYPGGIDKYLLASQLEHHEGAAFPWYLPIQRHLAVFECEL